MNIVEGYVVNPDNEWCKPFALGEVNYSNKVLRLKVNTFKGILRQKSNLLQTYYFGLEWDGGPKLLGAALRGTWYELFDQFKGILGRFLRILWAK